MSSSSSLRLVRCSRYLDSIRRMVQERARFSTWDVTIHQAIDQGIIGLAVQVDMLVESKVCIYNVKEEMRRAR